ncbi:hypothetical protein L917_21157 [Phytophthora nicotianae]|uniref:SET domain-containing protein n=2 Tax=Phytophthora nicotianae TaxID=4792 RepID=W2Q8M7_PHYN3|nr:hypothetical protein PPTG_12374 [Phytophthora nicotianae INRA-310]ETL77959.1 hypothetical protein L917_21157 [Phytophthora nicotianae]ETN08620.1 hypothetical protein PPTG_12374 [Phytophthora nicotianae INRA-310]
MVHLALHWKLRCIQDSSASEDENTPPKMLRENTTQDKITSKKSCGDKSSDDSSSTGTATPPWMSPGFTKFGYLKAVSNQPPASQSSTETEDSPLRRSRLVASHTASSSVLLNNTTPRPPPLTTARTEGTERRRSAGYQPSWFHSSWKCGDRSTKAALDSFQRHLCVGTLAPPSRASPGTIQPASYGLPRGAQLQICECIDPCHADSCRNALMNVICSINCCTYEGMCGNGLHESKKKQPPTEIRLRPERPEHSVRMAINAERMGGLMRFANHSFDPVAKVVEVGNGRRTTVVVVTTKRIRRGQEITADYGDDLWFVCRCGSAECRHRAIQGCCDP